MKKLNEIVDYCLSKKDTYVDFPFGDIPICIKYNKHLFAEIYPEADNYKITLRCEPEIGQIYREKYPEIILPGYHVSLKQRKYKNTIKLDNEIIGNEIYKLIDESYETLMKKNVKRQTST
jgi:predicted DNA-binding protein (MmcQ/YjbR family)